jgi:Family of unknown function (DUF5686)/CarboxypepD_reg-like domain
VRRIQKRKTSFLIPLVFFVSFAGLLQAQETIVQGKVIDANSGDPIPFVNIVYKGTGVGVTTDFDGNFLLKTGKPTDTLVASYIGYKSRAKAIKKGIRQTINFQLLEDVTNLQEVVVMSGENPAFEILRKTVRNKEKNDKRKLTAYEYDTYTKIEIDIDHISDEFREKKIVKKITQVMDSIERIAGEDGKPILPIYITESVSKLYYRDDPALKKEHILKSKINGVGVEDGSTTIQFIGSSFQEYNFYQNWLTIVTKEFVSPIADGWRIYYDYDLTDSLYIGDDFCYRLDFYPKSPQELAFTGTIWITKKEFALKQIDATVGSQANLNFIEKIKIQQELAPSDLGPWLPIKNRVLIDVGELSKKSAGMLAKFYTSNRNFVTNKPLEKAFYERPILVAEDARMFEEEKYWDTLRLRNIAIVHTYTEIIKAFLDGYVKVGKVEIGPYLGFIAWNNIEGLRTQFGFKTNINFSKRWIYNLQLGYGFKDSRVKYSASATKIMSKQRWTTLSFRVRSDIARIGVDDETLADNPLFLTATRWGFFRRGYYFNEYRVAFQRELFKGFSQKISFRNWSFDPTYNFGYYEDPSDLNSQILEEFQSTEVSLESRYARDELFIQNDNERLSLGTDKWPVITLKYTHGVSGVFGSDFDYDKIRLSVKKRITWGPLGYSYLTITGENVFNTLPYPLLTLHLGNQSPLYSTVNYSLMNYGEFVSDHFASLQYQHYLEGLFLNRIPLLKKLNWRLLATTNIIAGGMRQSNRNLISTTNSSGDGVEKVGFLKNKPYVELGYGVENIFRFLRVDFVHRVSYLENDKARKFGVLFTVQLQL